MNRVIWIDAGHSGVWPKGDPGVVSGKKVESHYTFAYAIRLKEVLEDAGYEVQLTRNQDIYKVDNRERTKGTKAGDLFISLHFDSVNGKRLIYFASQYDDGESRKLAQALDGHLQTGDLRPSTSSRFSRLYIDDSSCPAVLIEIDTIDKADSSEAAKLDFSNKVLAGINDFLGVKVHPTPFQRVFVLEGGREWQLPVDRMSIVGDKLYIRMKE